MLNTNNIVRIPPEYQITVEDILDRADEIASTPTHGRPSSDSEYKPKIETKVRLDPEVIDWLKTQGPRHYSRINGILKAVMEAEQLGTHK
ncbi:MAG: BrnA antitoxin family protein [Granulosicoccus sp.]